MEAIAWANNKNNPFNNDTDKTPNGKNIAGIVNNGDIWPVLILKFNAIYVAIYNNVVNIRPVIINPYV